MENLRLWLISLKEVLHTERMNVLLLIDENRHSLRRARVFRDRMDPFDVSETELLKHYRFTKDAILEITKLLLLILKKLKKLQRKLMAFESEKS